MFLEREHSLHHSQEMTEKVGDDCRRESLDAQPVNSFDLGSNSCRKCNASRSKRILKFVLGNVCLGCLCVP